MAKTALMLRTTMIRDVIVDRAMESTVHVEKTESVPDDAAVFHYDELSEGFKDQFPKLIGDTSVEESVCSASVLSNGDYVKFTDYYQVTCQ
ncbi:hypothetical protein [Halococcus thailandensis]|uniref:hypothetical protein n=1 Tax=Halococcus thailandensis TaxID=335952 RepID=UPI001F4CB756|nr:hypothetical protein [Halococcus thailandensis]